MATDDDDAATLRERVRDLEATVAQQQDTIEQLMPSRRAILAGGAGLVGGAALTGQASAQSAAGQVGTSSEPVDVEAATVTATDVNTDSVNTDQTTINGINYLSETVTIADDAVGTIDVSDFELLTISGGFTGCGAFLICGFGRIANSLLGRKTTELGGTPLDGTTGPDDSLNIARDDNTLYLENRLGSEQEYTVFAPSETIAE